MKKFLVFPNESVQRILLGTPTGHKHVRVFIETDETVLVFHEATVANLLRAFVTIQTHPQKTAVELVQQKSDRFRPGFARVQHLEKSGNSQKKVDAVFARLDAQSQIFSQ